MNLISISEPIPRRSLLIAGLAGGVTAVISPPHASATTVLPPVRYRDKQSVTDFQNQLNKRGFTVGRFGSDGSFGSDTRRGVMAYQRYYGLKVDGNPGPITRGHMASHPTAPKALFAHLVDRRGLTRTAGSVMYVDISQKKAYAFKNGVYLRSFVIRPGGRVLDKRTGKYVIKHTDVGAFRVLYRKVNGYSDEFDAPMPFTVSYTRGGEAFHFSQDFYDNGYGPDGKSGSNGCINGANLWDNRFIYNHMPPGSRVFAQN